MLLFITLTLVSGLFGQSRSIGYDNYCRDNPQMPTCVHRDLKLTRPTIQLDEKFQERWGNKRSVPTVQQATASRPPQRMTAASVKPAKPEHLWRFVPPGTRMIIGIKMRVLRESEAWRSLMGQLKGLVPTGDTRGIFDSLDDIDEVWMTSSAAEKGEPIGMMRGRFNSANWRRQIPAADRATPSIETLLLGTAPGIAAAKRRIVAASSPVVEITGVARKMAAEHDLWVVADSQELMANGLKPSADAPPALAHVRGLALGVSLRDPLVAELRAETDSIEAAAQILEWARKSAADSKDWQEIGGKLDFHRDGNAVQLRVEVDSTKVQTMIAERTRRKSPPAPGKPGKVVIHGMEGGTKELPYTSTQQ